jgi:alpha/beta superfamily hydrolase
MVARTFLQLGWTSVRFNFRGIGRSEGTWDEGRGEVEDALAVVAEMRGRSEFAGPAVGPGGLFFRRLRRRHRRRPLPEADKPRRLVLVGPSTEKQAVPKVPADTVVLHGEVDDVVPLSATLAWARPQSCRDRLSRGRPLLPRTIDLAEKRAPA